MEPNPNYTEQNKLLAELHELRKNRLKPNTMQTEQGFKPEQPKVEWQLEKEQEKLPKLYVNPLIYDTTPKKPETVLMMSRLFNEDVGRKSCGFDVAKKIERIFMTTYGFESEVLDHVADIGCPLLVLNEMKGVGWRFKENYYGYSNWTVATPEKNSSWGVFHTKLWLIQFGGFLRVVVGTGNLHLADWSVWSNALWYQDFPLKQKDQPPKTLKKSEEEFDKDRDFEQTLRASVESMFGKETAHLFKIKLGDYSFENVDVVLIPSIPGSYNVDQQKGQGIAKIRRVVSHYLKTEKIALEKPVLTANSTSLGDFSEGFLKLMYSSFTGESECDLKNVRLVYPSEDHVQNSQVPPDPLFFSRKNWEQSPASRRVFHALEPNPQHPIRGLMPHLKTVAVESQAASDNVILYVGSHNFTKAAWGSVTKASKQPVTQTNSLSATASWVSCS